MEVLPVKINDYVMAASDDTMPLIDTLLGTRVIDNRLYNLFVQFRTADYRLSDSSRPAASLVF